MLADATRVRIILALRDGELPVNQLAELVHKSQAAVSQHLAKLRLGRVVTTRQEGTRVYYRLANRPGPPARYRCDLQAEHSLDRTPRHHHAGIMGEADPAVVPW